MNMKKVAPINILIACDKNYAPYYGVLLSSLFRHNPKQAFRIYLVTDGTWSKSQEQKFRQLCKRHCSEFHVIIVDADIVKNCPVVPNYHVNVSAYYHILSPLILPQEIDKIIYMDGDMIVCDDICDLWSLDMEGYAMAAALDSVAFWDETYERLGYKAKYGYINNGVSIINLKYWREHHIYEKAVAFMNAHSDSLRLMDQDTENGVLREKMKILPITYNFQIMFLAEYFWNRFDDDFKTNVLETAKHPIVIHYNGGTKPWSWRYWKLPYRREWLREYWHSPWWFAYQIQPIGKYIKHLIKRIVRRRKTIAAQQSQYIPESHGL